MMTEDNFLDFTCPHCQETISFPREHAGLLEACPSCAEDFLTPDPSSAAEAPSSGLPAARKIPLPHESTRLTLRRFVARDWKDLLAMQSDESLWHFTDGGFMDEAAVLDWLEKDRYVRFTSPGQTIHLALQLKAELAPGDSSNLVGYVSLDLQHQRQANFTLWIAQPHQRQGFGREATHSLLAFCFGGLNLHRLSAFCDTRNEPALALLRKAGLRLEGTFLKNRFVQNQWTSTAFFATLKEEFQSGSLHAQV